MTAALSTLDIWLAMLGMGLITLLLRASFLLLPPSVDLPALMRRALRFVPAAVLTAIYAPELVMQSGVLHAAADNPRIWAGAVAIAVAWRFHQTYLTIVAGMLGLHVAVAFV